MELLNNVSKIDICSTLFKRGNYGFITDVAGLRHEKQYECFKLLSDNSHIEICYGGAAGGGKSWLGCSWILFMCLNYPQTRWFIGREELKRLRESTLMTFYKVSSAYGCEAGTLWKYNGQDHYIQFNNGSRVDLLDLKFLPSDPLFERYGSVEYTGGWIEEAGEVDFSAFDTLKTRIGRQLNDKYGITRKLFLTCNPKKNWLYFDFYKPSYEGTLLDYRYFLQALYTDNVFRESGYDSALESITDISKRQRLKDGNWEYENDKTALCDYDAITDVFTNDIQPTNKRFLSADLAMQGRDRFVVGVWDGMVCTVAVDKQESNGKEIESDLKRLMVIHNIGRSRTVADSDGLGAYLESYLQGIKEFHGGASAIDKKEYANLKAECAYKLAEMINDRKIKISCTPEQRVSIIEELSLLRAESVDKDEKKKRIIKKEEMKKIIQRSPDYLDMLIMRMVFEVKKTTIKVYAI